MFWNNNEEANFSFYTAVLFEFKVGDYDFLDGLMNIWNLNWE